MIGLIQLVTEAHVDIDGKKVAAIGQGLLVLLGIEKDDTQATAKKLIDRILNYRVFPDAAGKMNLSLKDVSGGLLLVPQFTLVAETNKGTRPGFSKGMPPEDGKNLFSWTTDYAKGQHENTHAGTFSAYMQVSLCNDGPVTFILSA